jgi:uncharacterized protein YdeI (YjbR/CyaY-like superfamily)
MPSQDPRVDAYIARAAPFAQPILEKLRAIVHEACPGVEETMKWSMPCFMHAGGILCSMAAFKQHVSFGFWKHALVMGEHVERDGMGSFGKMASTRDLPPKKELLALVRKAARLNEQGVKVPVARKAAPKPPPVAPDDLAAALKKNKAAAATFKAFPPSQQREYIEWLSEAKRVETRAKRLAQAVEWLAEGKPRNWKYMNC